MLLLLVAGAVGQRTGSTPGAVCPTVLQAIASLVMARILATAAAS
jgi:hypothetical protein